MTDESKNTSFPSPFPPSAPSPRPSNGKASRTPHPNKANGNHAPQGNKRPVANKRSTAAVPDAPTQPGGFAAFANRKEREVEPNGQEFSLAELSSKTVKELKAFMEDEGIEASPKTYKRELVFLAGKQLAQRGATLRGEGCLEIDKKSGYGFLRFAYNSYSAQEGDICVSKKLIKSCGLLDGQTVVGLIRVPEDQDKYFCLREVESVDGMAVEENRKCDFFENLTVIYPEERFVLERGKHAEGDSTCRIIDIFAPIGKGQRGLIVSPPKSGKTTMMKHIIHAIEENHPEVEMIVLLIDERPEEVTAMKRSVKGEVVDSTFDERSTRHVQVAETVIAKAKRRVEMGKDVVIMLDSITRLARAYNSVAPNTGRTMTGGVDSEALKLPKRFFGAARNIEHGGSLTIIATALQETGTSMDNIIYEEFKGTGNMEIRLDRNISERGIFPAVSLKRSSTRNEELLLDERTLKIASRTRKSCSGNQEAKTAEWLNDWMDKTDSNAQMIKAMLMKGD